MENGNWKLEREDLEAGGWKAEAETVFQFRFSSFDFRFSNFGSRFSNLKFQIL